MLGVLSSSSLAACGRVVVGAGNTDSHNDARSEAGADGSAVGAHDAAATGTEDALAGRDAGLDSAKDSGPDAVNDATSACRQTPVNLRSAAGFAVLAGSTVTSTGLSVVTGDLGVSPGTAITGFPPGTMVGAQHAGDPVAAQAIADLATAYGDAKGRTLCPISVAGDLSGQRLAPGLYKSTSSLELSTGDLVLDGKGDATAVFIFQMASTLTTTAGRQVMLVNGASAANVTWQVGTSATLGTTSAFAGTIVADQAITLKTGARLTGRALAHIAAVTLDGNVITKP
ncbi:MAG: hypothetical protein JWM82_1579 [Myxococcales bacterium]|nr:hypothetical protein [Myxococcales bacterium]